MANILKLDGKTGCSIKAFILALILVALFAEFAMAKERQVFKSRVAAINANPSKLSGKRISGKLEGLKISNAHIKGMTMEDVEAEWAEIKNITFENCTFTRVFMLNSHFENVAFKNCTIRNKGNPEELLNRTIFTKSIMKDVLFENTQLLNVDMKGLKGRQGYLFFKNMRDVLPPRGVGSILSGVGINFRIVDSDIDLASFNVSNEKNSSFYAKKCTFKRPHIRSDFLYIEQCNIKNGAVRAYKDMVIKDSVLEQSNTLPHQKAYLLNNVYENNETNPLNAFGKPLKPVYRNAVITGREGSHTYILQRDKQKKPAHLNFEEGDVTVQGVQFFDMGFYPSPEVSERPMYEMNLRNVEILNWSPWSKRHLLGGKWENVKIHGPILVKNTKIENVQAYNLTFPKGEPWEREGDFVFNVTKSPKPFKWEEIKVPTPEEMGLEWWPMEPGYHPEKGK